MPGFTAEALPQIGAVRLVLDLSDDSGLDPAGKVQVFRSLISPLSVDPGSPEFLAALVKVRPKPTYSLDESQQYGQPVDMFNTVGVWYDSEAPLDTPVWYVAEPFGGDWSMLYGTALVPLVANGDFETDIAGWQADPDGAITWNNGSPIFGTGSLRVRATVIPTAGWTGARTTAEIPVTAGHMYGFSAWLRASGDPSEVQFGVDWLDVAHNWLAASYPPQADIPGGNIAVRRSGTALAPVGAVYAQPRVAMTGPDADQVVIVDAVRFHAMGDPPDATTPVTLASDGGGWFTDPTTPASDVRLSLLPVDGCDVDALLAGTSSGVIFASHAADVRAAGGSRFDVVDQPEPLPVTGVRRAATSALTLASMSFADRDRVHTVLAPGRVTMLRLPTEFGIPDRYCDVGDVATSALSPDLRLPYRVHDLPYASTVEPAGPASGVVGTRIGDLDRHLTWAEFDAAQLTSTDLLHGAGSTLGSVTP